MTKKKPNRRGGGNRAYELSKEAESFVIDKGIPMPPRSVTVRYPFIKMNVGDSFSVPLAKRDTVKSAVKTANASLTPKTFSMRTIVSDIDRNKRVVRVWRVEDRDE